MSNSKFAIFGFGGFAREVASLIQTENLGSYLFVVQDTFDDFSRANLVKESEYDPETHGLPIVAIGSPATRKKVTESIVAKFPGIEFPSLVSKKAHFGVNVSFGVGNLVMQGCVLTCDIKLSDHVQLNINTTIGHDVVLGPYTTTAPGVHINGCVSTGDSVYFGSNSSTVENITLTENIVVGAGAVVVKNLDLPGTYVGIPAKLLGSSRK